MKSVAPLLKPLAKAVPGGLWLVGGVLRDALLDRPLRDVDFAVAGDPLAAAKKLGAALKSKPFPLDAGRGIYRVVEKAGGRVFDFAKLQGRTIEQDVLKRDFRINALALQIESVGDWKRKLIDIVEGVKDIQAKRIRLVADAALKDDPLRLLRAFRFSAELGFAIAPKTLAAVRKHARLLPDSAAERIRDELYKILVTPDSARVLLAMDKVRLLPAVFPEAEGMRKTAHEYYGKEGVWGHSLAAVVSLDKLMTELDAFFPAFAPKLKEYLNEPVGGYPRYAVLKIVELLHDIGKPATAKKEEGKLHFHGHDHAGMKIAQKIAERLRLSNDENRSISRMVGAHMRPGNLGHQPVLTDRAVYRFYRDLDTDAVGMLIVSLADHFTYLSDKQRKAQKDPVFLVIRKMLAQYFQKRETVQPPKLVDGNMLIEKLGVAEGPRIGRLLNAIREAQATGKVKTVAQGLKLAAQLLETKELAATPERRKDKDEDA